MTRTSIPLRRASLGLLALMTGIGAAIIGGLGVTGPPQAAALAAPTTSVAARHMDVRLEAETLTPAPGSRVRVAFRMTAEPGWHGYWYNPGDSGAAPTVTWTLPSGVTAGALRHPAPRTLSVAGLVSYVHEGSYALLSELRIPSSATAGTKLPVSATLDYLVCSETACVPESRTLALELAVGDGATPAAASRGFAAMSAALPRSAPRSGTLRVEDGTIRVAVPAPPGLTAARARLYPDSPDVFEAAAAQSVALRDGELVFAAPTSLTATPASFTGVIGAADGRGPAYAVTAKASGAPIPPLAGETPPPAPSEIAGPTTESASSVAPEVDGLDAAGSSPLAPFGPPLDPAARPLVNASLLAAFLGALLGGLILNLMPCVFPILSLKALSIARSGGSESAARGEALAYAAGAIGVCVALGAALLALRAGGAEIGWAFQLQDPRVILLLLALTLAIAFNLTGLFELRGFGFGQKLSERPGPAGAFWTGTLAAFVATPCTGPFMGAALGAALLLPPAGALLVFAGLGLGLALPFLLIGFVPALRARLPRPGPWMDGLRRFLSLPMFATALALAWVLGRQTGVDGMTFGLLIAFAIAAGLWWLGRWQARGAGRLWLPFAPVALALAAGLLLIPETAGPKAGAVARTGASEPFSEARLAALRADRVPVFVDFTADWCLTCKVNDKLAIDTQRTRTAFRNAGVVTLVGDWTDGDPAITRFLAANGRNSIPYYLFYGPEGPPRELPQILSSDLLEKAAHDAASRKVASGKATID